MARPPIKPLGDLPENTGNSPIPNITAEEFRGHIVIIRRQLDQITTALVGNELGTTGVIPRLDAVEKKAEASDRKLLVWGSLFTAAWGAVLVLKEYIRKA